MRGAPHVNGGNLLVDGIIPADAGSTLTRLLEKAHREDHPRGCGEHSIGEPEAIIQEGSSPRMRGAPSAWPPSNARAGDHPRGCGEHPAEHMGLRLSKGSSPRMRGARILVLPLVCVPGIIPADAGSTLWYPRES